MPSVARSDPHTDTQVARLRARLTALRRPSDVLPGGRRRLDASDPVAAISAEVDETLLPRCLYFENGGGDCLALEVASGRVLSVARAEIAGEKEAFSALPGHAFFDADDPMCALLFRALSGFATRCDSLTVRANIVQEPQGFTNIGVALRALGRFAAAEAAPAEMPMAQVLEQLRELALAAVSCRDGRIAESWGPAAERERLAELARDELVAPDEPGTVSARRMLAWGGDLERSVFYVLLGCGSEVALLAVPARQIGPLTRLWLGDQAR